ncbi:MAG: hypothetical protein O3A00_28575, partial [Planctomycetota bacterium]|nr:hypothetical protein [Planctomycetota bacterium]
DILQTLAFITRGQDRWEESAATCERILEIEPRATAPYQRLIFFHALTMQPRKMVGWIRLSMDRGREPPEAYPYLLIANSLRFSNGEFVTHKWLQSHPDYEPLLVARAIYNVRGDAGKVIRESGQRPESLKSSSLDDARRRFPENFELLAFDLQKAVDQGDVATVNGLLPRVPENAQLDSRFLRFVGWSHAAGGQLQDALQSYRAAIAADPFDWRARHELANVLRRMSRLDEVATEVELASLGKKLESEVLELKNPSEISGELLGRIADYSNSCGEKKVAARLRRRVSN